MTVIALTQGSVIRKLISVKPLCAAKISESTGIPKRRLYGVMNRLMRMGLVRSVEIQCDDCGRRHTGYVA